jgi:hypothetical protein
MMPIERTAREPRDLQTHDQANMTKSDFSDEMLKAKPVDDRGS